MDSTQGSRVIDTMNAVERQRAVEGMNQAMLLADLVSAGICRVRNALRSAEHAMTLVYGRRAR